MKKHWLFFQSGTGGHWLSYVADCLVNGDYNFVAQDSHKDSYHNHTLVSERMPLLWVNPSHWKYADFKIIATNEHNITPTVIYEPKYVWNCFQNWLIKHELFWNKHSDESFKFDTAYKAFSVFNKWNDITSLKNITPIIYHTLYTDPERFINRTYSELSRVIPGFDNRDNKLFYSKIEEYKSKCKPYNTLQYTNYWYGFIFGFALTQHTGSQMLHEFRTQKNGIEWFINEEYAKYEERFMDYHVLKV